MQPLEQALAELMPPFQCDLWYMQVVGKNLKLFIDKAGGATLADCANVSRYISDVLENDQRFAALMLKAGLGNHYVLEVSTPGLDRILCRKRHFQAHVGGLLKLVFVPESEPRSVDAAALTLTMVGKLVAADEQNIVVEADGDRYTVSYTQIVRARAATSMVEKKSAPGLALRSRKQSSSKTLTRKAKGSLRK